MRWAAVFTGTPVQDSKLPFPFEARMVLPLVQEGSQGESPLQELQGADPGTQEGNPSAVLQPRL